MAQSKVRESSQLQHGTILFHSDVNVNLRVSYMLNMALKCFKDVSEVLVWSKNGISNGL